MKLAVFGRMSDTGQRFIKLALRYGYSVNVLLRSDDTMRLHHKNLTTIHGALDNQSDLTNLLQGCHAVIGMPDDTYGTVTIGNIVSGMDAHGLQRIILSTSHLHELDPQTSGQSTITNIMRQTTLDWTIVHSGSFDANTLPSQETTTFNVSAGDFAKFVINQITDVSHLRAAVVLSQ